MPVIPMTFDPALPRYEVNPTDLFITPEAVALHSCKALKNLTGITEDMRMLDPGCGTGRWGEAMNKVFNYPMTWGVDIENRLDYPKGYITPEPYDFYEVKDFLQWTWHEKENCYFDLIIGNPPFTSKTNRNLAEDFIWHSKKLLRPNGVLAFILKTEYVASEIRTRLFKEWPPRYVVQYVPRIKWDGHQFNNTIEYAFYIWKNDGVKHRAELWHLNWRTGELY